MPGSPTRHAAPTTRSTISSAPDRAGTTAPWPGVGRGVRLPNLVRCRVRVQQHHGALRVGRLRRPPQAISPEHHPLTGTPPSPAGQRRRITAAPVVPRDRAMSVEQADRDEGPMACTAVCCAGSRPDGTAPAAGVRAMRCGETTRARTSRIAIGRFPAAARTR
jgi:hypothetical protein